MGYAQLDKFTGSTSHCTAWKMCKFRRKKTPKVIQSTLGTTAALNEQRFSSWCINSSAMSGSKIFFLFCSSCLFRTYLLNIFRIIFGQGFPLLRIIFPLFLCRVTGNKDQLLDEICLVCLGTVSKEAWLRKENDYIKAYKRAQSYCYPSFYFYAHGDSLVATGSSVSAERSHITKSSIYV